MGMLVAACLRFCEYLKNTVRERTRKFAIQIVLQKIPQSEYSERETTVKVGECGCNSINRKRILFKAFCL